MARKHTLDVVLPAEPIVLHADLTRLAQALANLLNNAAKFTEPGGQIRLEAELDGGELQIRVRDDGIGIEPELLPHIFDLFFQSATSPDRAHGGLGIGLTLVRTLVEMHGGEVSAYSEGAGCGSEFTVRLPARRGARTPAVRAGRRRAAAGARAAHPAGGGQRRFGRVARAPAAPARPRDAHRARRHRGPRARARRCGPDAVLLDIGLPGLDGFEVARSLREQADADGTLLVAVSGYGQEADRRRATRRRLRPPPREARPAGRAEPGAGAGAAAAALALSAALTRGGPARPGAARARPRAAAPCAPSAPRSGSPRGAPTRT